MMQARYYQTELENAIFNEWANGAEVVAAVLPTGGGKTFVFSSVVKKMNTPTCAIAHRQELVHQISMSLARWGIPHKIIGPDSVIRMAVRSQVEKFGRDFYEPNSPVAVAGVDTLTARADQLKHWAKGTKLWVLDEVHHLTRENKWGRAVKLFPNARGLGVTATLGRTDGAGLGRHADGFIDTFVQGPPMRQLIREGYLTPYRVIAPLTHIDLSQVTHGKDGDFTRKKLKAQVRKSSIVGDVVKEYINHANGKLGLTFATDVETARDFTAAFNETGVPAELITAKTPANVREGIFRRFERKQLLQIVNVDILGEGFDCPAIEVVSFARPTESFNLFAQQFGRSLRPMPGNPNKVALIIDHVGNIVRHMFPDRVMDWSLDRAEKRNKHKGGLPVRICARCTSCFESVHKLCPYCGYYPKPTDRSKPEFVDGDLTEMSEELIRALQGEIYRINVPHSDVFHRLRGAGMSQPIAAGAAKQHRLRQEAQDVLRATIAQWAGYQRAAGRPDHESYRLFYHMFGTDVLSAQSLGRPAAEALTDRINERMG